MPRCRGRAGCGTPVGWGTLGYALPAAVGAAAGTGRPVLAVCGDGGAAYALPELATLVQERLPVCVLVVDDQGYGMLRFDQARAGHALRGVDLEGPDWLALGTAYGVSTRGVRPSGRRRWDGPAVGARMGGRAGQVRPCSTCRGRTSRPGRPRPAGPTTDVSCV